MARPKSYASAAEKQKAYRDRKRNENAVTKQCPYCQSDAFFDVSGKVRFFRMLETSNPCGLVYLCVSCNAYITIDEQNRPFMWNIVIKPNLASV